MEGKKNSDSAKCRCLSRRRFLETGIHSLSAVALSGAALSLLASCNQQPLSSGAGGGASVFIPNDPSNVYTLSFSQFPDLNSPGGSAHVMIQATSGPKDLFVTRVDAGTADTVSTICTHLRCTLLGYNASTQQYVCPCHNSIFGPSGNVIQGPAVVPLPKYATTVTGSGIQVTVT